MSKRLVSIGSVQNERYSLDAQPVSDHDNEDEYVVHSNKHSLCMCVFDGHDGSLAVKFVKKLIDKQVCGKPLWDDVTKFEKPEKIEAALADYIEKTDKNFFKSIDPFIKERRKLQSKIPKVLCCIICLLARNWITIMEKQFRDYSDIASRTLCIFKLEIIK